MTGTLLPALSGHRLEVLWVELAALVVAARLLGGAARRLGQPAVVGNLVAGLLLGPSVLGHLWPAALHWFVPAGAAQGDLLTTVAQLALLVLLVVVGTETDVPLIRALGPAAVSVAAISLVLPLLAGAAAAELLPVGFRAGHHHGAFIVLMAGAIGVSSLPVVATIMGDLRLLRRTFAQLALAAGTANDTVGFILATAATGLAASGSTGRLAVALSGLVLVVVVVFTVGQRVVDGVLRQVRRRGPDVTASLTVALAAALAAAAVTQALGLEGALGGFLAGIALGRSRFQHGPALDELRRLTDAFFAPLFFATAGLRVDVGVLGHLDVAVATVALVVAAMAVKFGSGLLGARTARLPWRDGAALGAVLNGRGTMQVIIAGAGLAAGVFTTTSYTVVIVLAMASSLAVAPLLSWTVRGWQGSPEEQARLDEEDRLGTNVVVRGERLLLATGGTASSVVAASVLHQAWPHHLPVTVLSVGDDTVTGTSGRAAAWMFPDRAVEVSRIRSDDVLGVVLAETQLSYGVLGLGASESPGGERLLSAVVDDLVTQCPIPMVVARRALPTVPSARRDVAGAGPLLGRGRGRDRPPGRGGSQGRPGADGPSVEPAEGDGRPAGAAGATRARSDEMVFRDILVPVAGTPASRGAQEVAFGLAAARRGRVTVLHVLTRQRRAGGTSAPRPDDETGRRILADAARFALRHGATVRTRTRRGPSPGEEIVRLAAETDVDVIVLGAVARSLDGRPFLGHTVEHVLAHARAAVVVVVLPSDLPSSSSEANHAATEAATDEATDAATPPNGAQRSGSGPG